MRSTEVHRAYLDAVTSRDWDRVRELLHPDFRYQDSDGSEHKGPQAAIDVGETYTSAFPDLSLEVVRELEVDATTSVIEFIARGTHDGELMGIAPTGRRVSMPVCNVVDLEDGRIIEEHEYYDTRAMLEQLGVEA